MIPRQVSASSSRWVSRLPSFARRAFHADQMEFDSALSQMYSLLVQPSLVSKMSKARSMTKNHYYRDDPAFVLVQLFFFLVVNVSWGVCFQVSFSRCLANMGTDILLNYAPACIIFALVTWIVVNRFFIGRGTEYGGVAANAATTADGRRDVEWQYAIDVHCNAYFVYFVWTRVVLCVAAPIALREGFFARVVGNGIVLTGCVGYVYNVFLGYLELPMLTQQQRLMYPIPFLVAIFLLLTIFTSWNVPLEAATSRWGNRVFKYEGWMGM